MNNRVPLLLFALAAAFAPRAEAASLDLTTEYRMRVLAYSNLSLNTEQPNNHSFISQSARLGFVLKNIHLTDARGESETLDIAIKLRALGVAGSTTPFATPFDRAADQYPDTSFVPFLENAYLAAHHLGGVPWDLTVGRQTFRLGTGLLLDDNGAGLTGISAKGDLPWGGIKTEGFMFQARNSQLGAVANNLDVFGFTVEVPSEGTWQLHQLIEKDRTTQTAAPNGCGGAGCLVSGATRWFSSLRYRIAFGPLVFDGEAALQKGAATPTDAPGVAAAQNHVTYDGNAQVFRAKWKQRFYRDVRGIARFTLARGSGDDPTTPTTDEAFFPSNGHRFDGLERAGIGEFFGATPYDAFGGQSTATASGLHRGVSGIIAVGMGVTPPAYRGIVMDLDYYLFQADRNLGPDRTLGTEFDIRLRYDIRERFTLRASAALFNAGNASNVVKNSSRRYLFEAMGRF
ncbi:MAG: hypothetical protein ABII00_01220 [Elusimicrobiota bacterium]